MGGGVYGRYPGRGGKGNGQEVRAGLRDMEKKSNDTCARGCLSHEFVRRRSFRSC